MADDQVDERVTGAAPDRVLHSDPHDFAGLYIRHRASFTLHARRYLRDARDADEVVQEAFLRLFLALPELETELQALAYCRRTITNLCIDRFRAQARRPTLVGLDTVADDDLADDELVDPVVRAEDAAVVRSALSMLSPLHRAALVKREIEEATLPVIAEELDIPEESVKHVLFRARRALRRILANSSVAPGGELGDVLVRAVKKGGGGLAGLLAVLALSTGPDLQAVPVVGQDLPDLPSIVEIGRGVVDAVTESGVFGGDGGGSSADAPGGESGGAAAAPDASPSPTALPGPATSTVVLVPASPAPGTSPSSASSASPSASPVGSPTPVRVAPTVIPSLEPARGEPSAAPGAGRDKDKPSDAGRGGNDKAPSASPSAAAPASPSASPIADRFSGEAVPTQQPEEPATDKRTKKDDDPSAWKTDGLEWITDPETGELVRVPLGSTDRFS